MEVKIKKSDLTLEHFGNLNYTLLASDGISLSQSRIPIEGVAGFNDNIVIPLFKLFDSHQAFYRAYEVVGALNKDNPLVAEPIRFFSIANLRQTAFLFETFKKLGINLNELRIGLGTNTNTLFLHPKIIITLKSLSIELQQQLVLQIYNIYRLLNAATTCNLQMLGNTMTMSKPVFEDFCRIYGSLNEETNINCIAVSDEMLPIIQITYFSSYTTAPEPNTVTDIKSTSEYCYNTLTLEDGKELLIICNKSFTPKTFYIVNEHIIYTNNELALYNTTTFSEFLPKLITRIYHIRATKYPCSSYIIKYVPIEQLFNIEKASIGIEVKSPFNMNLLQSYGNINENYDFTIYNNFYGNINITSNLGIANIKDQYINDTFAQQLYTQALPYYDSFNLKNLTGIVKGFLKGEVFSLLFEGDAGTGKSTAARVIPYKCGIPYIAINCSTNIEESDIIGTMIPNPNKISVEDSEFIWKDGILTTAVRNGYTAIFEELGGARPGVLMKLNSLLDESRQLDLPTGEIVKAHPNFRLIATTNIGYEGTNRLNKALIDRFQICKKFENLDITEMTNIIVSRTGYKDLTNIGNVLKIFMAIKKYSDEQNLGLIISIRSLLDIFTIGKYYKSALEAIETILLNKAFLEEPEHLQNFKDTVLKAFETSFKI